MGSESSGRCVPYAVQKGVPILKSQLMMIAKFSAAVSAKPVTVCSGGVSLDVFKTLDKNPSNKVGLHYLYTIHTLQFEKLKSNPL